MTNIFQYPYDTRLQNWYSLRQSLKGKSTEIICIEVDKWWQQAPLINHYLHTDFANEWPDPWELISDNEYCYIARGLGMVYTLHLLGVQDIEFVEAKDYNNEDVAIVLVDNAKYILNYWPNTVVNNNLKEFKISKRINVAPIITKIG